VVQACIALHEAHALGIVHRDLKPSNLFRVPGDDGAWVIKVLDFGIAKLSEELRKGDDGCLTVTGTTIGSPRYMSPEQIRASGEVDFRTDIWSLGVTLFELLSQASPFAETANPLTFYERMIHSEPRSLSACRPEVSGALEAVVRRCLQKDPAARYQSIDDLMLVLLPFTLGEERARVSRALVGSMTPAQNAGHDAGQNVSATTSDETRNDCLGWLTDSDDRPPRQPVTALVLVWCQDDPERVGEVALLPADGCPRILGRGGTQPADDCERVRFVRQRPTATEPCPALEGTGLSRRQLLLVPRDSGIEFRSLNGTGIWQNGHACPEGLLCLGDSLRIGEQLVLYCTCRHLPILTEPCRGFEQSPKFGTVDRFAMIGESETMWLMRDEVAHAATAAEHTLVHGPSGSGKELLARALHGLSARSSGPFVARNAATIPQSLVDAELFGNMRSYPNPGTPEREGLIGAADGGTLFLDEVGELPSEIQGHLLRVLDAGGEYHRLGDASVRHSSFRLVAATNRDPEALKPDLLARLPMRIQVPGLGERREDIPLLVQHVLRLMAESEPDLRRRFAEPRPTEAAMFRLAPSFLDELVRRDYTSHVRELRGLLWRSIRVSSSHFLESAEPLSPRKALLPAPPTARQGQLGCSRGAMRPVAIRPEDPAPDTILRALERSRGNLAAAARDLGLSSRFVLHRLVQKYALARPAGSRH
jgi:two-component system nitrogen regulation response regulator GlnG/two-component system response regulator HydG